MPHHSDAREAILAVAERLFAAHGLDGVSLRQLTGEAGVNLAAVNYYFGGKLELYQAVLERRIRPLNRHRMEALNRVSSAATGASLEEILDAMLQPLLDTHADPARGGPTGLRILLRCLVDPSPAVLGENLTQELQSTLNRFAQAIRRHVPQLPPEEFLWRLMFVVGAMQHALASFEQMSQLTHGICSNRDYDGARSRFVSFAASVFRARFDRKSNCQNSLK